MQTAATVVWFSYFNYQNLLKITLPNYYHNYGIKKYNVMNGYANNVMLTMDLK